MILALVVSGVDLTLVLIGLIAPKLRVKKALILPPEDITSGTMIGRNSAFHTVNLSL